MRSLVKGSGVLLLLAALAACHGRLGGEDFSVSGREHILVKHEDLRREHGIHQVGDTEEGRHDGVVVSPSLVNASARPKAVVDET